MDYSQIYVRRISKLRKVRGITVDRLAIVSDVTQSILDTIMRGLTPPGA